MEGAGYASSGRDGSEAQGVLVSPEFTIQRRYLNLRLAGLRALPAEVGAELVLSRDPTRVVRALSAPDDPTQALHWRTWDVRELAGRTVRLRLNDHTARGWLAADSIEQSDEPRARPVTAETLFHETYRPQFHFTTKAGWQNDANGMFFHDGLWHLCHQFRAPGDPSLSWGHATSPDLLHWTHQPVAIPGEPDASIFSGSATVDAQNLTGWQEGPEPPILLCYTRQPFPATRQRATQCLSVSRDGGHTFTKLPGNPVLETKDWYDRDPKLLCDPVSRAFYLVLSLSRNNEVSRKEATYGFFRSTDGRHWTESQRVGPGGFYWECPDFFELPIEGEPGQVKWLLMKGSGDYVLGSFTGGQFQPEAEPTHECFGSFYGAQTFADAPGRRVQIGWMNSGPKGELPEAYPGMPFNQQMSFPRELILRRTPAGLRLSRLPVAEIAQLYTKTEKRAPRALASGENALAGIHGALLDVELELVLGSARAVKLNLRGQELSYDVKTKRLQAFGRQVPVEAPEGKLRLRVLLDRTSLELFANDGQVTHAGVFFPPEEIPEARLEVAGGTAQVERLEVHELRSIWP